MSKLPETTATGDQPQDTKVIPFLPVSAASWGNTSRRLPPSWP
jgi:hypothetical protein